VQRGTAPETLLDTYHGERHPVGSRLLLNTRAQGMLFLRGEEMQPLRDVLGELVAYPEVARHLAAMVSGLEIRYDVGTGSHPLLGMRMPPLALTRKGRATSTAQLLHPARGLLLDLADNAELRRRSAGWTDRIDLVTAVPADPAPGSLAGTTALLVRPDGYVAWAAPGSHHDLPMALERWFGPAR
jgi:bifunctional hydroxylase/dehydrase